jgi:hypothetical protein
LLLVGKELVDRRDHLVRELLDLALGALELVRGELSVVLQGLELVANGSAQVADCHASFLGLVPHHLHELLAALLGEGREREPDSDPVVGRGDAQVRRLDRFLYRTQGRTVVRGDDQQPCLWDAQPRNLAKLHLGTVDVDRQMLH